MRSISDDLGRRRRHFLESRHRLLCMLLLQETNHAVQNNDCQNRKCIHPFTERTREDRGENQNQYHQIFELCRQLPPSWSRRCLGQLVLAELLTAFLYFDRRQPLLNVQRARY